MKSNLSTAFFGNKKFLLDQYKNLQERKGITNEQIKTIFEPYTLNLQEAVSNDGSSTLLPIFCEFVKANAVKFFDWPFQKFSAWLQISAHVFEHSFQNHLNQKQSFQYFSQVVIRHSLFRPPHSVNVFTCAEAKQMMDYWLGAFVRYYQQYRQCFQSEHNEILYTIVPSFSPEEQFIQTKKQISREEMASKFGNVLAINDAPKKSA